MSERRGIGGSPSFREQTEFRERHSERETPVVMPAAGVTRTLLQLTGGSERRARPCHRDPDFTGEAAAPPVAPTTRDPDD
ncbi:MAG: hypothetical protein ACTH30_03405 [Leucobacter sp.]